MGCTRKPAGPVHPRSGAGAVPTTMLACIATVLWFVAPLCGAKDLIDETWIELRSPHLVVVSALSEARTAVLAQSLEKFRIAVALIPDVGRLPPTRPTRIYLLPFTSATLDFSNRHRAFASLSLRGNDIAILDSQGDNDELLKHFYAHGLIQGTNDVGSPRWLDEGIAQLLSSVHVRGTAIDIGDVLVRNGKILGWGGWMPFTSLLEAHGPAHFTYWHRDQFYAQSWLLMHYLMLGRKDIDFPAQVRRYLTISRAGTARVPAFEQAFGLRVEDLRQILRVYMRDLGSGALSIAQPLADAAVIVRPLPQDEIAAQLGRLKTVYGRYDEAQPLFGASLALNPRNTTALIGTGDQLTRAGKFADAERYYQQAVVIEPHNALYELDYAGIYLHRATAGRGTARAHPDLEEARRHLQRSLELAPDTAEGFQQMGLTYLEPGEATAQALPPLLRAHALLPWEPDICYALAQAYAANHQLDAARQELRALMTWADLNKDPEIYDAELVALDRRSTPAARETNAPGALPPPPATR